VLIIECVNNLLWRFNSRESSARLMQTQFGGFRTPYEIYTKLRRFLVYHGKTNLLLQPHIYIPRNWKSAWRKGSILKYILGVKTHSKRRMCSPTEIRISRMKSLNLHVKEIVNARNEERFSGIKYKAMFIQRLKNYVRLTQRNASDLGSPIAE